MLSRKPAVLACVPVLILALSAAVSYASEVYYMGQGSGDDASATAKQAYSWQKRVDDLVDFNNYGNYGLDRSGMITGSAMEEVSWNDVGGNGSMSFLKKGVYQNTEVNLNAYERLWEDYNFDGEIFMRRTDDRRIETRKDIRVKQLTTRISNPDNMLLFGDFYGDFSQFTLGNSLEGFYTELKPCETVQFKGVAARSQSPDNDKATFWRNVAGGKTDFFLFRGSDAFSTFRTGVQAITNQDDGATADSSDRATPIPDINNTVVSTDGEISFKKYLSIFYELARSANIPDENTPESMDYQYGNAFRVNPAFRLGPAAVKYLYYFVQPKFYTDAGSAMSDKIQHQVSVDYQVNKKTRASFVENYYWNHLDGSSQNYRTIYDEKYMTLYMRPWDKDKDFTIRTYTNIQNRHSDDEYNTLRATTLTPGIGINDMLDSKTSYGYFYEYRAYIDRYQKRNSDYFNRLGGNIGREQMILARRAYVSVNVSFDIHDPRQYTKNEVTTNVSFSGQYNLYAAHMLYFGYNVITANSVVPMQNYFNNLSYAEVNFLMEKKRNARLVFRGEHNRYNQDDRGQCYDETRIICKIISNF